MGVNNNFMLELVITEGYVLSVFSKMSYYYFTSSIDLDILFEFSEFESKLPSHFHFDIEISLTNSI